MRALFLALGLLLLFSVPGDAQFGADYSRGASHGTVTISSAVAGTRVVPSIRAGLRVGVPSGAAVPVCFVYVDSNLSCATALTDPVSAEPCIPAGSGYLFDADAEKWVGQVCAILQSGAVAVTIGFNSF